MTEPPLALVTAMISKARSSRTFVSYSLHAATPSGLAFWRLMHSQSRIMILMSVMAIAWSESIGLVRIRRGDAVSQGIALDALTAAFAVTS